jgi:preprotein translocase subunit SecA
VEYKKEALRLFKEQELSYVEQVRKILAQLFEQNIVSQENTKLQEIGEKAHDISKVALSAGASKKKKIGRNDPCPCGSGKKYKKCCGINI